MPAFRPAVAEFEADRYVLKMSDPVLPDPTEENPNPAPSNTILETNGPELALKYGGRWDEVNRLLWVPTLSGVINPADGDYVMCDTATNQTTVVPRAEFEAKYESVG